MHESAMDVEAAARYLGVTASAMRAWKSKGNGPRFFKAGRLVRYRKQDLDNWIEQRLSQPGA